MSPEYDFLEKVAEFRDFGLTVFEAVFSESVMQGCRELLRGFVRENPQKWALGGLIELDTTLALTLAANPTILDFAEEVMGPFVQLDGLTLVALKPTIGDDEARVAGWHRDPWGQVPRSHAFERPMAINALCYLQDLTDETGPLRVIRGSHRHPVTIPKEARREPHPLEEAIYPKAGDFVLVHNNLVHTATSPREPIKVRDFISVFYNLTWLKPTIQCSGRQAQNLIARFRANRDHRMLRLLGVDEHLQERNDCGFLTKDEEMWARWAANDRAMIKPEE